ncbi:hypothetical protein [Natronobacterium gregoryi]|uniref:Amidohydrolase 2 n=1 Tax=Natronobacterium gregoryi (strain ATCC 43098 / DSM 3393 / CCM 3738 / CIP 104747 / IAM 13177 / JCM 8860 / NBRC 102187 / NCIMB 2189 / SP2) TaxID=797304 RepID=L9XYW5_NATGS|nr:hypothetical protein [Natronobacterium gregoryi]ELY66687.1 amidohydrolase 2 [Natronobacterium gregoryi SP2]PLK21397.1 hypothetical protein CYV19_05010 [Natronobacterium gregoryi SP2]
MNARGANVGPADLERISERSLDDRGRLWALFAEYDSVSGDSSMWAGWNALTRDETLGQELLDTHTNGSCSGRTRSPGQAVSRFDLFDPFELDGEA